MLGEDCTSILEWNARILPFGLLKRLEEEAEEIRSLSSEVPWRRGEAERDEQPRHQSLVRNDATELTTARPYIFEILGPFGYSDHKERRRQCESRR